MEQNPEGLIDDRRCKDRYSNPTAMWGVCHFCANTGQAFLLINTLEINMHEMLLPSFLCFLLQMKQWLGWQWLEIQ